MMACLSCFLGLIVKKLAFVLVSRVFLKKFVFQFVTFLNQVNRIVAAILKFFRAQVILFILFNLKMFNY